MGLTSTEAVSLSDEAFDLITEIREATSKTSERGKRLSKQERKDLIRACLSLASKLTLDILD